MKRRSTLIAVALSATVTAGLTATALAQRGGDNPSRAKEVAGPAVGPAGQTGELHYFENPGKEYAGGATMVGPYRVLPPGTKYISRDWPGPVPKTIEYSADPATWSQTALVLPEPAGFRQTSAQATILDGTRVATVDYVWSSAAGQIHARVLVIPEARLPLDVYLTFDDSPIVNTVMKIEGGFAVAVASAQSPGPSPTPPASTTATPPSGPSYKGRPCGVGRLIHDFLIVQEPPPGPRATCIEPLKSAAPELLYHLRSVPAGLFFDGVLRDDSRGQGLAYVIYKSTADPDGAPALQIVLSRSYLDPDPLILRDESVVTAADFLPVPGVALRDEVLRDALWHEAAGRYWITIDQQRTSLTLEEVAALLERFSPPPAPAPPPTGTGRVQPASPVSPLSVFGFLLATGGGVLVTSLLFGPLGRVRTRPGGRP
jgi:hypothetical protein